MVAVWVGLIGLLAGCSQESRLEGHVYDVWGNPVEGATVVMEGQSERPLTDKAGRFSLPWLPGDHKIKAGREGYVQDHLSIAVPEQAGADAPAVEFALWPKPEDPGFYAKGIDTYVHLDPEQVRIVGNQDLQSYRGIRFVTARTDGKTLSVLFHTPLKMDKVMRLGLTLHRMEYIEQAKMTGPVAEVNVDVDLWVPTKEIPLEVVPLHSRTDYLLTAKDLEPGTYTIDTQHLLKGASEDDFHEVPEPWRVAYPFEVR